MQRSVKLLVFNAIIAALYASLTAFLPALTYGPVQFRFGEALTILPMLIPTGYIGIAVGCFVANLFSPFGPWDVVIGTLVTFVAGLLTSRIKNPWVAALPPVLLNAAVLPLVWLLAQNDAAYLLNAGSMLLSQSAVLYFLGVPLYFALKKAIPNTLANLQPQKRKDDQTPPKK